MKNISFLKIILVIALIGSCTNQSSSDDNSVNQALTAKTELNVSYGPNSQQVYDLYLPANRNSLKTKSIIIIHGGGWTSGDKAEMNGIVTLLQSVLPEYAIINMNYVLANGTTAPAFPNQINDIKEVMQKIEAEKEDLQINATAAFFGISAGAHLSALYAYSEDNNNRIKAVVNMVGPVDFTDPFYTNNAGFQLLLNGLIDDSAFPAGTDIAVAVSPALQVTAQSPPTINFYGNTDPLVAISQLTSLETALNGHNVINESTIYNGGHGNWSAIQFIDLQTKVKAFMELHY